MDFELTDEQELIRNTVREFAEAELAPVAGEVDRNHRFPAEAIPKMAGLGLMGMPWPEKVGGAGADYVSYLIALEEVARGCATTSVIMTAHTTLATSPIVKFGTEAQKDKYLFDMASGRRLGAFALTEPAAGTDAAAGTCTAILKGDSYVLNGSKIFISNAPYAEIYIVFAKTDPDAPGTRGMSAFIVEKDTPGFTMGPKMRGIGWRGLDTRELYFDDVEVPDDHLVGDPDLGLSQFLRTLEVGRISIAALSLSLTQAVLDLATDYARQRVQFGQPISSFQAVQFKLADMATELEAARWLTYRAASLRDAGRPFLKEAAMAKLKASRLATWAASEAVQIHGGLGYMLDSPVARFYCDAKVLEIGEGTNEIQHLVIARALGC